MRDCPDNICVTGLFKAIPHEEAGERVLYFEASNESIDYQGERILTEALAKSKDYFLRFGNIDMDHLTLLGPKQGIGDYHLYEIGYPVDVQIRSPSTFVKAIIYQGEGETAKRANEVWDSLTKQSPPARWYPSVGGSIQQRDAELDPETGETVKVVSSVRWSNIGISKFPVNLKVAGAAVMPFGAFAKGWSGDSFDLRKALTASAATDATALTGGGALGQQSLDRKIYTYWDFRDHTASALKRRKVRGGSKAIHAYAVAQGIPEDEAAEWTERFIDDLKSNLKRLKA